MESQPTLPYTAFELTWGDQNTTFHNPSYEEEVAAGLPISRSQLKLLDPIGQGAFGLVYKAHLSGTMEHTSGSSTANMPMVVAVKTLKGFYDRNQVMELMRESNKMSSFDHPHILPLIGVCLDGGPAPYVVTPFMANGSLLSYLKAKRSELIIERSTDDTENIQVSTVSKRLIDMCYQISRGMEYLVSKRFIHRDLATRNCMIDSNLVIKVADFGLCESIYSKAYFRERGESVKLPVKWMAVESLSDGIFSEKTDVWSFGITCWEVFNGGKNPYPGVDPVVMAGLLEAGYRMKRTRNTACTDEMNAVINSCWAHDPSNRPTFSEIVKSLSHMLTVMSGYMDLSTISTFGGWHGAEGELPEGMTIPEELDAEAEEVIEDGLKEKREVNLDSGSFMEDN